jgi:LuxR family maltose regulon positive regulatory protein
MKALLEKDEYINRYITYDIIMGRFYARLGLTERVAPWLRQEREEVETNSQFRGFDTLIKVVCLLAEKNYPAALQSLELAQAKSEVRTFLLGFLEMAALESVIRHQLGDREGAVKTLKKACDAALPNALVMPFVELGEPMYSLVNTILKARQKKGGGQNIEGIEQDWLYAIRRDASAYAKKRSLVAAQYKDPDTAASPDLSDPELEVLSGLSRGRTSEEIAEDMKISPNMFSSFLRSVFTKLGAVNRADAIRIATEKGLL